MSTRITSIWAECGHIIGIDGELAILDKEDMAIFKQYTDGKYVVCGRKTLESLPFKLPNRFTICLSTDVECSDSRCDIVLHSKEEVVAWAEGHNVAELVVIGGEHVYNTFMDLISEAIVTKFRPELLGQNALENAKSVAMAPEMNQEGIPKISVVKETDNFTCYKYQWEESYEQF